MPSHAIFHQEIGRLVDDATHPATKAPFSADISSIEKALSDLVDVDTMDRIGDLVVGAPVDQVIGMIRLAKLIGERTR